MGGGRLSLWHRHHRSFVHSGAATRHAPRWLASALRRDAMRWVRRGSKKTWLVWLHLPSRRRGRGGLALHKHSLPSSPFSKNVSGAEICCRPPDSFFNFRRGGRGAARTRACMLQSCCKNAAPAAQIPICFVGDSRFWFVPADSLFVGTSRQWYFVWDSRYWFFVGTSRYWLFGWIQPTASFSLVPADICFFVGDSRFSFSLGTADRFSLVPADIGFWLVTARRCIVRRMRRLAHAQ